MISIFFFFLQMTVIGPSQLYSAVIFKESPKCILTLSDILEFTVKTNMKSAYLHESVSTMIFFFFLALQYQSAHVGIRRWALNGTSPATAPLTNPRR